MLNSTQTKPIKGFENYTISIDGKVFNGRKTLKYWKNKGGYCCVKLTSTVGVKKHFTLHRLVAEHFIPNPEFKSEVNHLDGNKENNTISNLVWATSVENKRHGIEIGLIKYNKPTKGIKLGGLKKGSSNFFGVCWDTARNKWRVAVSKNNKPYKQKRFDCEIEAAKYHDRLCEELGYTDKPRNFV